MLREEFPGLKSRLPSLWSRSYYVGSAGHVSADTIQKYISNKSGASSLSERTALRFGHAVLHYDI
jgi:REP element-mobilizing transposase RayT